MDDDITRELDALVARCEAERLTGAAPPTPSPAQPAPPPPPPARKAFPFEPALLRARHDGWTTERQTGFIDALAETACVTEACARVGMSPHAAYALRRRVEASSFRQAWDAALDFGIRRLSDAAIGRALHGVARPVFYQGEQVGERRYFDERLTLFLLRYRDPLRYGKYQDDLVWSGPAEATAYRLFRATAQVEHDADAAAAYGEVDDAASNIADGQVDGDVA